MYHRPNLPWPVCPSIELSSPPQCGFKTCYVRVWFSTSRIGRSYTVQVRLVSHSAYCLLVATLPGWGLISRDVILSVSTTGWTSCVLHAGGGSACCGAGGRSPCILCCRLSG